MEWRPIETAPKDGTIIEVMGEDVGSWVMRWNPNGYNSALGSGPGLWENPEGFTTWSVENGMGPTHWRPIVH